MDKVQLLQMVEKVLLDTIDETHATLLTIQSVTEKEVVLKLTGDFNKRLIPDMERTISSVLQNHNSAFNNIPVTILEPLLKKRRRPQKRGILEEVRNKKKARKPAEGDGLKNVKLVLKRSSSLHGLRKLVSEKLPDHYKNHFQVMNWRHGTLVIAVQSGAMATRMRFEKSKLEVLLRKELEHESLKVEFAISPESFRTIVPESRSLKFKSASPDAVKGIKQAADFIEDNELSKALRRLAETIAAKPKKN